MKKAITITTSLLVLLLIGVFTLPFIIDLNKHKDLFLEQIEEAAGFRVEINGELDLDLFPDVSVKVNKVKLPGKEQEIATVDVMQLHLSFFSLLKGNIKISDITLINPKFSFIKISEKKTNLDILSAKKAKTVTTPESKEQNITNKDNSENSFLESITNNSFSIDSINIQNGVLNYNDIPKGINQVIRDINFSSSFGFGENKFKLKASLQGFAENLANISAEGIYNIGLEDLELKETKITLGQIEFSPTLNYHYNKDKPFVKIGVFLKNADLNPYLKLFGEKTSPENKATNKKANNPKTKSSSQKGNVNQSRWSKEKFDLSFIENFNGHLGLHLENLKYAELSLEKLVFHAHLQDQTINMKIKESSFLGGQITGDGVLEVKDNETIYNVKALLDKIDFAELKKTNPVLANLKGSAISNINLFSKGRSQHSIINNLSGKMDIEISNGYIKGMDILSIAAGLLNNAKNQENTTEFAKVTGSFNIKDGIVNNNDLKLSVNVIEFLGEGIIDLPKWQIDYKLTPKVKERDEQKMLLGIKFPVVIKGSLDDPYKGPDKEALKDQINQKIKDELIKKSIPKEISPLIDNILDNGLKGFGL